MTRDKAQNFADFLPREVLTKNFVFEQSRRISWSCILTRRLLLGGEVSSLMIEQEQDPRQNLREPFQNFWKTGPLNSPGAVWV